MKTKKYIIIILTLLFTLFMFVGCNKNGKNEPVVITINEEKIYTPEFMLYLIRVKDLFEELAGEDVWSIEDFSGGKTAEEVAKDGAINNLIRDQIVLGKAESIGISLTNEVKSTTEANAVSYFEANEERFNEFNITKEIVIRLILNQQIVEEVKEAIMNNPTNMPDETQIQEKMNENILYSQLVNIDASQSLRGLQVKYIFVKLSEVDANNQVIPYSEEERKKALEKVTEVHELALTGKNFDNLIATYSEEAQKEKTKGEYNFSYLKLDNEDKIFFQPDFTGQHDLSTVKLNDDLKAVLEGLEIGDVSKIVETRDGYHFFKAIGKEITSEKITTYEQSFITMVDNLRKTATNELKKNGFEVIYNDWKNETSIHIDQTIYDGIKIIR